MRKQRRGDGGGRGIREVMEKEQEIGGRRGPEEIQEED